MNINKIKSAINNWIKNKDIKITLVYWIIVILNKNKTSSHKQVEQLGFCLMELKQIIKNNIKKSKSFLYHIVVGLLLKLKKIMIKVNQVMSYKYSCIFIIIFWIVLLYLGYITETRIIRFLVILLIIAIYKILHKKVKKINLKEKQVWILLKIYKYKNPIIWLIIKIEEHLFNCMYNLTKKDIKPLYINIIYNILYNFTGYNFLKLMLCKIYCILNVWKIESIYDILFKRIYGMLLSILIFTNIIQIGINIIKQYNLNAIIIIYIIIIIVSYGTNYTNTWFKDLLNIERKRMRINLIGNILENNSIYKYLNKDIINKDIANYLWYIDLKEYVNYENYLKYRSLMYTGYMENNKWLEYSNKPSFFYYIRLLYYYYIDIDYIWIKNFDISDEKLLKCYEYNILLWKLKIFYIWDVEKALNIKESYLQVIRYDNDVYDVDVYIEYKLKTNEVLKIYYEHLPYIKLDEFWDLNKNEKFYQEMHTYLYDTDLKESEAYENGNKLFRKFMADIFWEYQEKENAIKKEEYLNKELKSYREEWEQKESKDAIKKDKYEKLFLEINKIKNKF